MQVRKLKWPKFISEAGNVQTGTGTRLQPVATAGIAPGAPVRHGYSPVNQGDRVILDVPVSQTDSDTLPMNNPMASAPPSYHAVTTTNQYPPPPQPAPEPVPNAPPPDDMEDVSTCTLVLGSIYMCM